MYLPKKEGFSPPFLSFLLPICVFVIPFLVYCLGLPGGFEFDDGVNIVKNEHIRIQSLDYQSLKQAALSTNSGPLRRPAVMLSFALNYYFSQESVEAYKITNIAIHGLNALLVYFITCLIFQRTPGFSEKKQLLAFGASLLWALLPINLTSVLYVIQRMVSLGGFFALLSILCWFAARIKIEQRSSFPYVYGFLFIVNYILAVLCKETYILTGLLVILLEWVMFTRNSRLENGLWAIQISILSVSLITLVFLLVYSPEIIAGDYSHRPFTMLERLLTQSRAIVFYIWLILIPSNVRLGLYHDAFQVSHGVFDPVTTILSISALLLVFLYAFVNRQKNRILFLGVLWFFGWHLLESTFVSLELVHEHRNYLASIGVIWIVFFAFAKLSDVVEHKPILYTLVSSVFLVNAAITSLRAEEWSDLVNHSLAEVEHHPHSVRASYQLGRVYLILYYASQEKELLYLSEKSFSNAARLSDYDLLPWFGIIRVGLLLEKDVSNTVRELSEKFETSKIPSSTIVALSDFQECLKEKQCNGLQDYYVDLIDALLRNNTLDKSSLSELFRLKASYISEVLGSYPLAFEVLREGVSVLPYDFHLRKSVLYYYVITGDKKNAEMELKKFVTDFEENRDTQRIAKEVCEIFEERGYKLGC